MRETKTVFTFDQSFVRYEARNNSTMAQEDRPHDYDSAGGQSQAWMVSSGLDECVANCQNKNEMIAALYASTQGLLNTMTQSMVRGYPPPKKVNFEPTVGSLVCVTGNNGNYQKGLVNYVDKSSQKWKYSVFLVNENGNSNLVSKTVEANDIFVCIYLSLHNCNS